MKKILMIDNYDSFVYNIYQYVASMGVHVDIVENDKIDKMDNNYDGFIISPGPGSPKNKEDSGKLLEFIDYNREGHFLGICFGHQILGYYLGSDIKLSVRLMHGQIDYINHGDGKLYKNIPPRFEAIRYHSLVITENKNIIVDAYSEKDKEIMGFHSKNGNIFGIQFHPESYYSKYGFEIIKNFVGTL